MSDHILVANLGIGVSFVLFICLYFFYRDYRIDSVRDQLFGLRDELFLYAYEQGLPDDIAHTNLRLLMNGMIRYAHQISFFRLVALYWAKAIADVKTEYPKEHLEWMRAVAELQPDQKLRMEQFYSTAMLLVVKHMITGSPVLIASAILVGFCLLIRYRTKMLFDATASAMNNRIPPVRLFEAEAYKSALSA